MTLLLSITLFVIALLCWILIKQRRDLQLLKSSPKNQNSRIPPSNASPLFHIRYREDSGVSNRRDIFPIRASASEDAFEAWCYWREDERTFSFAQIEGVHDNQIRADIGAREFREWFGLSDTQSVFLDEQPDAIKQSPWPEDANKPFFRVQLRVGAENITAFECAPLRWGSNRKTMAALIFPSKEITYFDFSKIINAVDLQSGEIIDRCELWKQVLSHRADEELPWYVRLADQTPMARTTILACREAIGRFATKDLCHLNDGLTGIGVKGLSESDFGEIARNASRSQDETEAPSATAKQAMALLSPLQAQACLAILQKIADTKPTDAADRLRRHSAQLLT